MRLVSIVYDDFEAFEQLFPNVENVSIHTPEEIQEGDVLLFWGGGDISPSLYDRPVSYFGGGHTHWEDGWMDRHEWPIMQRAIEMGCFIIGVCRGAQMLCAAAGGTLIQHVNGHGGYHSVTTFDDQTFNVNSIHHQQMAPTGANYQLLAWCECRSQEYWDTNEDGDDIDLEKHPLGVDPEFIYFPDVKGFAIQWHPEMMAVNSAATEYVFNFIKKTMSDDTKDIMK